MIAVDFQSIIGGQRLHKFNFISEKRQMVSHKKFSFTFLFLFFFYFSELLPLHPSSGSQEYVDSCCFSVCKGPKGRRVSMHGNIREIVSDTMAGLMA